MSAGNSTDGEECGGLHGHASPPLANVIRDCSFDRRELTDRVLIGARFEHCTFRNCRFNGSDLSYTAFHDCDLYYADFTGAVLYSADFRASILNRANFSEAYLSGTRFRDVEVTRTRFGHELKLGRHRSSGPVTQETRDYMQEFGAAIHEEGAGENNTITAYETNHDGIGVDGFDRVIHFGYREDTESVAEQRDAANERSEIARTVKRVQLEAGYLDKALAYYRLEREWRRRGMDSAIRRSTDWLFGKLIWGYGVGWVNAALTLVASIALFALVFLLLPALVPGSGLLLDNGTFADFGSRFLDHVGLALYYASTFPIAGPSDVSAIGWARFVSVVEVAWLVVVLGLLVASVARRSANI